MVEYEYQGVDRTGTKITGKIEAPNEGELRLLLRNQKIRPTRISKAASSNQTIASIFGRGVLKVPSEALVIFTGQLQLLISSGVPIVQGLEILIDQTTHLSLKIVVRAIREKVSQGFYLWESMSAYPQVFSKFYIALIRAGEASGAIDTMLKRIARYLESSESLKRKVKGAMFYPVIVVCIGLGVVSAMLAFIIPKFEEMLISSHQELPLPTLIVIQSSHFLQSHILSILGILGITFYILRRYFSSEEGRILKDQIVFRLPFFGKIAQKSAVARFSRTMQSLLNSGINLVDAVDICKMTIDNGVIESAVSRIRSEIEGGKTLGAVITQIPVFPRMAVQMISIGESTGSIDKMLEKVADFYEEEVEQLVSGISRLVEPLLLVVLGGMVGGMMIAMYLPIFKLAGGA